MPISASKSSDDPSTTPDVLVKHLGDLRRYARRLTRQPALAQDLVQETYRRALETRARFQPGTNLRSWLFCIMRNLHCDHLRRARRQNVSPEQDVDDIPDTRRADDIWDQLTEADVAHALDALPVEPRRAILLHELEVKSYAQIAHELEIPIGTVGTRLLRARRRLCEHLMTRLA
jgi:RNA polymerase sigma-70 factor (ECF subfamily)